MADRSRSASPPRARPGSGSQSVFGTKASLVANTVRARIGGRLTALHIPAAEAAKVEKVSKDAAEQRRLRAPPEQGLALEYAYGYNGRGCQNLYGLGQMSYCYTLAALGIVWDEARKEQRIFQGHTAEITAMAFCPQSGRVATGQKMAPGDTTASILIWAAEEQPAPVTKQHILGHSQGIYSLAFSADGRWLFSVAAEDKGRKASKSELKANASPLCAWRIDDAPSKGPPRQLRAPQARLPVKEKVHLVAHPSDSSRLMAYGGRAVYFATCSWAAKDAAQSGKLLTPAPLHDFAGCAFYGFTSGCFLTDQEDLAVVAVSGGVFVIEAFSSDGPVCLRGLALPDLEVRFLVPWSSGEVACGGSGDTLLLLRSDLSSAKLKIAGLVPSVLDFATAARVDSPSGAQLIAGTAGGALCRLRVNTVVGYCSGELLQQSPSGKAEVRTLAVNPKKPGQLAVADSAGLVMFFDLDMQRLLDVARQFRAPVSAMTWDPSGLLLALGLESGHLRCLVIAELQAGRMSELDLNGLNIHDPATAITTLCFSPAGDVLAVGYRDGRIQLLQVQRPSTGTGTANGTTFNLTPCKVLQGNASAVLALQFAKDGSVLASNARDSAVLCWDMDTGKTVPANFPAEVWFGSGQGFRLTISWAMWGAWNKDSYRSSTAILAESHGSTKLMAVGDEDGLVKLQRFPLFIPDAFAKEYHGHCSRISGLAWAGPQRLVTAGAGSCGLLQWRLEAGARKKEQGPWRPRPAPGTASVRSARSANVGKGSAVSGASRSSTARSKSQSSGGPYRRPSSVAQRSASPKRRQDGASESVGSVASARPKSRGASSRLRGSGPSAERPFASKGKVEERFKDAAVQTETTAATVLTPRSIVTFAPPVNYANGYPNYPGRFIAVNQDPAANGAWQQVQSRPTSPIRYASPPRLVSMPQAYGQQLPCMSPRTAMRSPSFPVPLSPSAIAEGSALTHAVQNPAASVVRFVSAASALAPPSPSTSPVLRVQTPPPPARLSPWIYQPNLSEPVTRPPMRVMQPTPATTISACNSSDITQLCACEP